MATSSRTTKPAMRPRTDRILAVCRALWSEFPRDVTFRGRYYEVEHARLNTLFRSAARVFPEIYMAGGLRPRPGP